MPNEKKSAKQRTLFKRQEVWLPTRRGWFAVIAAVCILAYALMHNVQPFLAVTEVHSNCPLVVEGWLADYAIQQAVETFSDGEFTGFYVTGIPMERGAPLSEFGTYAELGAAVAIKLGADTNAVKAVPAPDVRQDRTFASAVALRKWFQENGRLPEKITVVSEGAHSRRTRLLFQYAFGPGTEVGIIAVPDREYDPKRWWASSAGVRDIADETVAYLYARLVFRPPSDD